MPVLAISKKSFGFNALASGMLPGAVGVSTPAVMVLNTRAIYLSSEEARSPLEGSILSSTPISLNSPSLGVRSLFNLPLAMSTSLGNLTSTSTSKKIPLLIINSGSFAAVSMSCSLCRNGPSPLLLSLSLSDVCPMVTGVL